MKPIRLAIICGTLCTCLTTNAFAACEILGLGSGQTCSGVGGTICSDGTCRSCCDGVSGGDTTTACSGASTSSQESFSDSIGSGYIPVTTYRKTCTCRER